MNMIGLMTLDKILKELQNDHCDIDDLRTKIGIDKNVLTGILNELDGVLIVKERTGRTKGEIIRNITSDDKINKKKLENYNAMIKEVKRDMTVWNERSLDRNLIFDKFRNLEKLSKKQIGNLMDFTSTFYTQIWFDIARFHIFKAHEKEFPLIVQDIKSWQKERGEMFQEIHDFIDSLKMSRKIFIQSWLKMENVSMTQIEKMYLVDRKSNF